MDNLNPRVPAIGVASGSSIYVYKNLRPSFQFNLPPVDVSGVEKDIWAKAKEVLVNLNQLPLSLFLKKNYFKGYN